MQSHAAPRRAGVLAFAIVVTGCGGGNEPQQAPELPDTPVISAPARLQVGSVGTASIPAQAGSYAWTVTGGEILSGAATREIAFRSTSPGEIALTAVVTNAAGSSPVGEATVQAFSVLTTLISSDVAGSPAEGLSEHDSAAGVAFSFTPGTGAATVVVDVDGILQAAANGVVPMDTNRILFAYGRPASGTDFDDMAVVPADPTVIPYPEFFEARAPVSARVADPYCGIVAPSIAYPAEYLGEFPLPAIDGAPLAAAVERGVMVKDYWAYSTANPTTNEGCSADWHDAVDETMRRIARLGADHVAIVQNAYLDDVNAETLHFNCMGDATCPSWAQIPDSEIAWAADRARAHGLDVHLYMQVDVHDINNAPLPTAPSAEFISKFFAAWKEYTAHIAAVSEAADIPAMQADWGVWWFDWPQPQYAPLYRSGMTEVAANMRTVFSGKVALGTLAPWASDDAALMDQVDWIIVELFGATLDAAENEAISVTQMKAKYLDLIGAYGSLLSKHGKPAAFRVYAQSHRDYLRDGWMEDGFCSPGCPQQAAATDFSVQAIAIEAQLEAITAQDDFALGTVDAMGYWFADVILPDTSFPNLSQSIRNKPAEAIVHRWFGP